jgi:hypothetical protein
MWSESHKDQHCFLFTLYLSETQFCNSSTSLSYRNVPQALLDSKVHCCVSEATTDRSLTTVRLLAYTSVFSILFLITHFNIIFLYELKSYKRCSGNGRRIKTELLDWNSVRCQSHSPARATPRVTCHSGSLYRRQYVPWGQSRNEDKTAVSYLHFYIQTLTAVSPLYWRDEGTVSP